MLVWDMREPGAVEPEPEGEQGQETARFAPQTGARWRWPPPAQPFPTPLGCGVYWSPDGAYLAAGGEDGIVYVWDAREGTLLQELKGHHSRVNTVGWSPGGCLLVSGSGSPTGGELFVWDPARGARIRTFVDHPGIVVVVAWGPDEDQVISGGTDGMLRWWNMHSGACEVVRPAHQGWMQYLKSSPDGTTLASFGQDGAIMLWDRRTGEPIRTLRRDRPYERLNITGIQGLTAAQKATLRLLGAIEDSAASPRRLG